MKQLKASCPQFQLTYCIHLDEMDLLKLIILSYLLITLIFDGRKKRLQISEGQISEGKLFSKRQKKSLPALGKFELLGIQLKYVTLHLV